MVENDKFDFIDTQWLDDPKFSNSTRSKNKENKLG